MDIISQRGRWCDCLQKMTDPAFGPPARSWSEANRQADTLNEPVGSRGDHQQRPGTRKSNARGGARAEPPEQRDDAGRDGDLPRFDPHVECREWKCDSSVCAGTDAEIAQHAREAQAV